MGIPKGSGVPPVLHRGTLMNQKFSRYTEVTNTVQIMTFLWLHFDLSHYSREASIAFSTKHGV